MAVAASLWAPWVSVIPAGEVECDETSSTFAARNNGLDAGVVGQVELSSRSHSRELCGEEARSILLLLLLVVVSCVTVGDRPHSSVSPGTDETTEGQDNKTRQGRRDYKQYKHLPRYLEARDRRATEEIRSCAEGAWPLQRNVSSRA